VKVWQETTTGRILRVRAVVTYRWTLTSYLTYFGHRIVSETTLIIQL
jgi:hypothetical protein